MKSSLVNMVVVLFVITLLASAGVGGVYMLTQEPIAQAELATEQEALRMVLPAFDATTSEPVEIDGLTAVVNTATNGGEVVGYAVKSPTKRGFNGEIILMVGFDTEGKILNVNVVKQAETPGLGTKMTDDGNSLLAGVVGKNPSQSNLTVSKDGGEVEALTAATISSRAYLDAVARAYNAFNSVAKPENGADVMTGATQTQTSEAQPAEAQEGGQNE